jgi:hypothetical protein
LIYGIYVIKEDHRSYWGKKQIQKVKEEQSKHMNPIDIHNTYTTTPSNLEVKENINKNKRTIFSTESFYIHSIKREILKELMRRPRPIEV